MNTPTETQTSESEITKLEALLRLVHEGELPSFAIHHPPGILEPQKETVTNRVHKVRQIKPGFWEVMTELPIPVDNDLSSPFNGLIAVIDQQVLYVSLSSHLHGQQTLNDVATKLVMESGVSCVSQHNSAIKLQIPDQMLEAAGERVQHLWEDYRAEVGESSANVTGFSQWLFSIKHPDKTHDE